MEGKMERGMVTDTTPITPYPPSSAAFSILTALLFSIDFAVLDVSNYSTR